MNYIHNSVALYLNEHQVWREPFSQEVIDRGLRELAAGACADCRASTEYRECCTVYHGKYTWIYADIQS